MLTQGAGRRYTMGDGVTGNDVPYDQRRFPMEMPDRVVRYTTTPRPGAKGAEQVTGVTVRRGDPGSAPIFEDFLYTNAPALKLHGARFFIEVREEGAVVIRKNGAPIAYQGSGITVQ